MNYIYRSYKIIDDILRNGAFSTIELNKALKLVEDSEKGVITKIVYGVLENSVKYEYYIKKLCSKKPKKSIISLLKVGMYLIYEMNSVPNYTAIDECVKIAKSLSKGALTSFVNGILRKALTIKIDEFEDKSTEISVKNSVPIFVVDKLIALYGEDVTLQILEKNQDNRVTIRNNGRMISSIDFENMLIEKGIFYEKVYNNAFKVKFTDVNNVIDNTLFTVQALASIIAVDCLNIKNTDQVLDICSAPGGKSIYASEMAKSVVACDIHPHRVRLIESYSNRMGAKNLVAVENDGRVTNEKFINNFDKVICDVPCSGIGVLQEKADILFDITKEKIEELSALQYEILSISSKYVKKGGCLLYSTCTLFEEENDKVLERFIKENSNYIVDKVEIELPHIDTKYGVQLLPNISKTIGFYLTKLIKKCY